MDERSKELVAIGASVTAHCQPCLNYHVDKARQYGATDEDVSDAIAVGEMVRKGAAKRFDQFSSSFRLIAATSDAGGHEPCKP